MHNPPGAGNARKEVNPSILRSISTEEFLFKTECLELEELK
jgi:hypothetical protein